MQKINKQYKLLNMDTEIKKYLPRAEENVNLANYSTFGIGGTARYFFNAKNKNEFKGAINAALAAKIPFLIFGGASNTLISDGNFPGLVIVIKGMPEEKDFAPIETEKDCFIVEADAGWPLFFLTQSAGNNALSGMEWAIGIPGTVGGAINGNAGAYGEEMGNVVEEVEVMKIINGKSEEKKFSKADCEFGYRTSIFKKDASLIILSARIKLKRGDAEKIKEEMKDRLSARMAKHPKGFSAGSVFKNYSGSVDEEVIKKYPELEQFVAKGTVPAAFLIDNCGLKGKSIGGAVISEEHANFIVNKGSASFADVVSLINIIKEKVEKKYKIKLEEEIKYLLF